MIPIRNIYYMLTYAWENTLKRDQEALMDSERFDNIYNLLASILIEGVNRLIKKGFIRGYMEYSEEIAVVKGKINLDRTIKSQSMIRKRLICDYDNFTQDILLNRIVKTTLLSLLSCSELDTKYVKKCKVLLRYFSEVDIVDISSIAFNRLRFNRNNQNYRLLINICELINTGLITQEDPGKYKFSTFIKDNAMAKLYEKFVLNFYKRELIGFKAYSPIINWQLDEFPEDNLLPIMRTDIVLENAENRFIIDTKYYPNALSKTNYGETKSLISNNLYQIYAYVKNSQFEGDVSGMLLYPTVDYELDQIYVMGGNNIYVNTVNLDVEFEEIKRRLIRIANQ